MGVELDRHPPAGVPLDGHPDLAIGPDAQKSLRLVARHLGGRPASFEAHFARPPPLRTALDFRRLDAHNPSINGRA